MKRACREVNDRDLTQLAATVQTPFYAYDLECVSRRVARLSELFGKGVSLRYAIKANPHPAILAHLNALGVLFDASSIGEVSRALDAGAVPSAISFTGPGKTKTEIVQAIENRIDALVLESMGQARQASEVARGLGQTQGVMVRVSPATSPKGFGARMTGRVTQFGIDEEDVPDAIEEILQLPGLRLDGFHFYTGSNSLESGAVVENMAIFSELSRRFAAISGKAPRRLIFGAGFGLNYHEGELPLDIEATAEGISGVFEDLSKDPNVAQAKIELELGRWLTGPAGTLVMSVVDRKPSRGETVCICDAGFHTHLAACGMMGSVLRRNWPIRNLSSPDADVEKVMLAGPLCTSIDLLAREIRLASPASGDLLAVSLSGAYGHSASPAGFISHPVAGEFIWNGAGFDLNGSDDD